MALPAPLLKSLRLLIFDLDGVITSEQIYLEAARNTIQELIESRDYMAFPQYFGSAAGHPFHPIERVIPFDLVTALKRRAVNSNWDLCYLTAGLHILGILAAFRKAGLSLCKEGATLEALFAGIRAESGKRPLDLGGGMIYAFLESLDAQQGISPLQHISHFIQIRMGARWVCLEPGEQLWHLCYAIFQEWMGGQRRSSYAEGLPATVLSEDTVVDRTELSMMLDCLCRAGYTLGIATGRPRQEAVPPLRDLGLLSYFEASRIITHDDVLEAESALSSSGPGVKLGKPHPLVIRKAMQPDMPVVQLGEANDTETVRTDTAVIGDSSADVIAAKRAGCISIGVLTGLGWSQEMRAIKRQMLMDLGCDTVLNDVLELPGILGVDCRRLHRGKHLQADVPDAGDSI
jgi:phosphoglycolate phosphatase-like HAD superfamily hydrolase